MNRSLFPTLMSSLSVVPLAVRVAPSSQRQSAQCGRLFVLLQVDERYGDALPAAQKERFRLPLSETGLC